jgi:hypothetical protein
VYADERLSPFFHGLPRDQIVAKQYAFLADLFSGERHYFGMNPFNAHHWMVISDDLFDHREALFEQTLRDHGLPEPMIRRWEALHERFRTEIVKPVARGRVMRGEEQPLRLHEVDHLDIDTVCDDCGRRFPPVGRAATSIASARCIAAPARASPPRIEGGIAQRFCGAPPFRGRRVIFRSCLRAAGGSTYACARRWRPTQDVGTSPQGDEESGANPGLPRSGDRERKARIAPGLTTRQAAPLGEAKASRPSPNTGHDRRAARPGVGSKALAGGSAGSSPRSRAHFRRRCR